MMMGLIMKKVLEGVEVEEEVDEEEEKEDDLNHNYCYDDNAREHFFELNLIKVTKVHAISHKNQLNCVKVCI